MGLAYVLSGQHQINCKIDILDMIVATLKCFEVDCYDDFVVVEKL